MWRFLQAVLDIVLPRKDRVVRIDSYELGNLSITPTTHELNGREITTLMSYKTKAVDDLIRALKYDRTPHAANLLAEALAEYLREELSQIKLFSSREIHLVPMPLHKNRIRDRGFNQMEAVLRALPIEFRDGTVSTLSSHLLQRTRDTPQQTRLSRKERLKNVAGAFSASDHIDNIHIVLVDDVTTTGATLSEATKILEKSGARVTPIALARA